MMVQSEPLRLLMYVRVSDPGCVHALSDFAKNEQPKKDTHMFLRSCNFMGICRLSSNICTSRAAQILGGPTSLGSKISNLYTMYRVFFRLKNDFSESLSGRSENQMKSRTFLNDRVFQKYVSTL